MVKLGLLCFLGFCFSYSRAGCPLGEVYSSCAQPISCVTCENPQPCPTLTCNPGCNCPDGQLRGPGSECIPRDQCPSKGECPVGEVHRDCAQPRSCVTCENPRPCQTFVCSPGCDCPRGHLRGPDGVCIPRNKCPNRRDHCKTNEIHKDCGSYCTPTCATWEKRHEIFCPAVCVKGCFCVDGLIKNDDGVCVSPANCSSQKGMSKRSILCKVDEIYMECGSACPATCANRNQPGQACIAVCRRGCFCRPGLLRNSDGRCVAPSQCQRPAEGNCRADQVYRKCGSACAPTCATTWYKRGGMACPAVCVEGCFCKGGLVKDVDGSCVMPRDCKTHRG